MKTANLSYIACVASIALIIALTSVWLAKPSASTITLPIGSKIAMRLAHSLTDKQNRPGHTFAGILNAPILISGRPAIPAGTELGGKVVAASPSGGVQGVQNDPRLRLTLDSMELGGHAYEIYTDDVVVRYGAGHGNLESLRSGTRDAAGLPVTLRTGIFATAFAQEASPVLPAGTVLSFSLIEPLIVPAKK